MEWLKQLLRSHGVGETGLDDLVVCFGKEMPKHMVPKQRYNALNESKKQIVEKLNERDRQVEKLKASIDTSKTRKLQADKLRSENKRLKEKYESEIRELRLLTALLIAVGGYSEPNESTR
ncbi:MAG: phage scaffolding protein [Cohnella sp.]|nr:phage scaffolding protein [Cohnella sp.]